MKRVHWILVAAVLAIATPALATTWTIAGPVTKVFILDNANNGGSSKQLEIYFSTTGNVCSGSSVSIIQISSSESTQFDNWVRLAQTAYLSGRPLEVRTSNASGSCKTWYVGLID